MFGVHAADALKSAGLTDSIAAPLGFGAVIAVVTYPSVIVGELVPTSLAFRNAEAMVLSRFLRTFVFG